MPGPYRNVLNVGEAYQDASLKQADIQQTLANTQKLNMATLLGQQQYDIAAKEQVAQDQYRGILQKMLLEPVGQNQTGLPSVQQDQQAVSQRDPNVAIMRDLSARQRQVDNMVKLAAATPGINPAPWIRQSEVIAQERRKVAADMSNQMQDNAKQTANLMAAVDSPQMASAALQHIADKFGPEAAQAIDARLQHDPQGEILWNTPNKQLFKTLGTQFTTQNEQAKQQQDGLNWQVRVAEQGEKVRHDVATEHERNAEIALRRDLGYANLAERKKSREQRYELAGVGTEVKITKDDQKRIDKIGDGAKMLDYNKANEVAAGIQAKLEDPKQGYEAINPANARSLLTQAQLMVANFRPRAGSKYESEQFNRMNGLMDRMAKYVEKIGTGDTLLAKDRMLELSKEMRNLYADRNADVLREELNVAQATNKKGGNATWLVMQGKLEDAIASGRAKRGVVDGKEFIVFQRPGIKPTKEDVFPVPSEPERRTVILPGDTGIE